MSIEKTYSSEKPNQFWYDKLKNGKVNIYLTDNVKQTEDVFEFDLYRLDTHYTSNLDERLTNGFNDFLELAKAQELERTKNELRKWREIYIFPIINRGQLFWDIQSELDSNRLIVAKDVYKQALDITDTLIKPELPDWWK